METGALDAMGAVITDVSDTQTQTQTQTQFARTLYERSALFGSMARALSNTSSASRVRFSRLSSSPNDMYADR